MKMLLFIFFASTTICNSFGQETIEADLLLSADSLRTKEIRFISCGSTVLNNSPLFIIDGRPYLPNSDNNLFEVLSPEEIVSISILKGLDAMSLYGSSGENGVVIVTTKNSTKTDISIKRYPFKVYNLLNPHWNSSDDMFNALRAKVPGVTIHTNSRFSTPKIQIRGEDNTIVIVDGIQYDTSILNTLNPANIESIKVSNSAAAQNYFINN